MNESHSSHFSVLLSACFLRIIVIVWFARSVKPFARWLQPFVVRRSVPTLLMRLSMTSLTNSLPLSGRMYFSGPYMLIQFHVSVFRHWQTQDKIYADSFKEFVGWQRHCRVLPWVYEFVALAWWTRFDDEIDVISHLLPKVDIFQSFKSGSSVFEHNLVN